MATLYVLRHAKSDWGAGASDHQRPLNQRGERSAMAVGRWLAAAGEVPDVVATSTATRAATTAALAAEAGDWQAPVEEEDRLYLADPSTLFDVARVTAREHRAERVMVVAHEPGCGALVGRMTGARTRFVTACVAAIETDLFPDALDRGTALLRFVVPPRTLLAAGVGPDVTTDA